MYCSQCGTELAAVSNFCPKCGKPIAARPQIDAPSRSESTLPKSSQLESATQPTNPELPAKGQIRKLFGFSYRVRPGYELLLLFAIYAIWIATNIPYSPSESKHSQNLGSGMIILCIISGFVFKNYWKAHNRKGWIGALVGVAVATVVVLFGETMHIRSQQKYEAAELVSEIKKDATDLAKSGFDEQGFTKPIEKQLDTTPTHTGDLGEEERFVKTFLNNIASLHNDYGRELDAIGWGNILNPDRVKQDKNLIRSRETIQKARNIVAKYRANTYTLIEKSQNDINMLNVSETSKKQILNGFNSGLSTTRPRIDAIWDLEEKTVSEFDNIFNFLATRRGAYSGAT